jgi:type II pantothenate kinase
MGIRMGLDIGGSTTKVVTYHNGQVGDFLLVQADDPVASAYGAVGKYLDISRQIPEAIDHIMVTGVGASYLGGNILGRDTIVVSEFNSVGLGGLFLAKKQAAIVVSMGTGTSFVDAVGNEVTHLIGSGVGGGTLLGLSESMLKVHDFDSFDSLLKAGKIENVDLTIGDISQKEIQGLPMDTTASNFGKVNDLASQADLAVGIVNLVFQSVGTAAVLCARQKGRGTVIFTGNLTRIKLGQNVLNSFAKLYGVEMIVPEHSEFATAVGAVLQGD